MSMANKYGQDPSHNENNSHWFSKKINQLIKHKFDEMAIYHDEH